jgi:hypothetical protein
LHTPEWRSMKISPLVATPAGCMHMPPTVCPLLEPTDRHAGKRHRHDALFYSFMSLGVSLCSIPIYPTEVHRPILRACSAVADRLTIRFRMSTRGGPRADTRRWTAPPQHCGLS